MNALRPAILAILLIASAASLRAQTIAPEFRSDAYCTRIKHIVDFLVANLANKPDPKTLEAVLRDHPGASNISEMYSLKYHGESGSLSNWGILSDYTGYLPSEKEKFKDWKQADEAKKNSEAYAKAYAAAFRPCLLSLGFKDETSTKPCSKLYMSLNGKLFAEVLCSTNPEFNYAVRLQILQP